MSRTLLPAVMLAALASPSLAGPARLTAFGPDLARGELVNLTAGSARSDPPAPGRPTVVVVHGLNPLHPLLHLVMAERYAEALGARHGGAVNVLGWDWNAATIRGLRAETNARHAVAQGRRLAGALLASGVDPAGLHLVGQSTGSVVVVAAARALADAGRPPSRLTLLDPAGAEHGILFGELAAATAARHVDHAWMPGLSGAGRPAPTPAGPLHETRLRPTTRALGLIFPGRADHFNAVRWHIGRVAP
jgi:hypothetical protein